MYNRSLVCDVISSSDIVSLMMLDLKFQNISFKKTVRLVSSNVGTNQFETDRIILPLHTISMIHLELFINAFTTNNLLKKTIYCDFYFIC